MRTQKKKEKDLKSFLRRKEKYWDENNNFMATPWCWIELAIREAFLLGAEVHNVGSHGAVGVVTKKGRICTECGLPIKDGK